MKYLKKFEIYDPKLKDPDNAYFQRFLIKFLEKIKPGDFIIKTGFYERGEDGSAIALIIVDPRKGYYYDKPVLTIRVLPVIDKKLKGIATKTKFKIYLKTNYDTHGISDQYFLDILIEYLNKILRKYSYWNKIDHHNFYGKLKQDYQYFINTDNIDNIVDELNDFEIYLNSKKYNL